VPLSCSKHNRRHLSGIALILILGTAPSLSAHNADVHLQMTDLAYQVMLAAKQGAVPLRTAIHSLPDAEELRVFLGDVGAAVDKLRRLPSGLPAPRQEVCIDTDFAKATGSNTPNWQAGGAFEKVHMAQVRYPVNTGYLSSNDCGIDAHWTPGAFYEEVNPGKVTGGDYTGVVLGFWAHQPDDEVDDVHLWYRLSNAVGLSKVKEALETAGGVAAGAVWVSVRCAVSCAESALTFGLAGDCEKCVDRAIQDAKDTVHDGVAEIDGLLPGFGDDTSSNYTGMPHHLNVTPAGQSGGRLYDDRPGLLADHAGPDGISDLIELLTTAWGDLSGMSVHYEPSLMPKPERYEIVSGRDFHPDTKHRREQDWQFLSWPHVPMTPLDNLARFGWEQFRQAPLERVKFLGWPLHALGDATVPHHVVATFGLGHRPFEDAVSNLMDELRFRGDRANASEQASRILLKALRWRRFILDWRRVHPEAQRDIPVRDLVTALAERTLAAVSGPGASSWPFESHMSSLYALSGPPRSFSISYYEEVPAVLDRNRDLLEEGVAAEIAFLTSAMEAVP
jgi:hypothetical protein